jgi:hypothetical protein
MNPRTIEKLKKNPHYRLSDEQIQEEDKHFDPEEMHNNNVPIHPSLERKQRVYRKK